jgi:ABC-2 type transport system ATP-binding protein
MDPIIHLENVCKDFKVLKRREGLKGSFLDLFSRDYQVVKAVRDVSMDIGKGEIVGYLGPNGAGKSTTIKMMTGVLEPTSGEILVNGRIPYKNRTANSQNIGVVFGQRTQLWWALPLIESLKILRDIYRIPEKQYKDMLEFYESIVDIKSLYSKPIRQMSLGQRTLSDILAAFLHNPPVVFLDEPTIGLDVSMKSKIRELIKALNQEKQTTVILTTHDMGDVDALCKRIVIIDKGTMLYDNSIENLKSFFGAYRTLKLQLGKNTADLTEDKMKENASQLNEYLHSTFPQAPSINVSVQEEWISVLINEEEADVMTVLNSIQKSRKVYDVAMEEISTESVIKKIYEGFGRTEAV